MPAARQPPTGLRRRDCKAGGPRVGRSSHWGQTIKPDRTKGQQYAEFPTKDHVNYGMGELANRVVGQRPEGVKRAVNRNLPAMAGPHSSPGEAWRSKARFPISPVPPPI